ncbi:MAG: RNA polymerase sigma factor [Bacteroidetes bacterium]|nr:RNA polymerase sigma factor [Bacteroidota bacterium]
MWLFKKKTFGDDQDMLLHYKQSGDQTVFSDLFKKHVTSIYGTCVFYLQDKDDAQDAVMQIFEKLLVDLRTREIENFKAWLSFVVRNHCISMIRKKKTQLKNNRSYCEFEYEETSYETELKIDSVSDDQMLQYMRDSMSSLKPKQRECVELFYLKSMSYQQIADSLHYSVNEVKSYIQNGKRNLKLLIEDKLKQPRKS